MNYEQTDRSASMAVLRCRVNGTTFYVSESGYATDGLPLARAFRDESDAALSSPALTREMRESGAPNWPEWEPCNVLIARADARSGTYRVRCSDCSGVGYYERTHDGEGVTVACGTCRTEGVVFVEEAPHA